MNLDVIFNNVLKQMNFKSSYRLFFNMLFMGFGLKTQANECVSKSYYELLN